MLDKREVALIILEVFDLKAPVIINRNFEEQWIEAIVEGLREAERREDHSRRD